MKICSIHIKGFQQFEDLYLDFTNPETGEPVDKVCFIGRNGTGKSTLLRLMERALEGNIADDIIEIKFDGGKNNTLVDNTSDLLMYCPVEHSNEVIRIGYNSPFGFQGDLPQVELNDALKLFKDFPYYHEVSNESIDKFWQLLIFLIKVRESEKESFENLPENIDKSKRQLIEEFDIHSPKILDKIAELWNRILDRAGLEFDVEGAKVPVQLTDNLQAYIRHKKTKEIIHYSQLSTGIRNFIFRIGHIYSLYFNREIKRGFLLVDEPENSLFPDFLFELMELYEEIIIDKNGEKNTQMFFATHSPIVAAQFEPYERIVLEWDDAGRVTAHKGKSPVGDDPNDVLVNDFQLDHLMGRKGEEMWEEYLRLRKKLRHTEDPSEKERLLSQLNKIGQAYNF